MPRQGGIPMNLFEWVRKFFKKNPAMREKIRKRARDAKGRFVKDDPDTEKNEAYK